MNMRAMAGPSLAAAVSSAAPSSGSGAFWQKFASDAASWKLGAFLWLAAVVLLVIVVLALALGRRGRGNRMSSGRVYSRQRGERQHPRRLVDDKYYEQPPNKTKY